MDVGCGADADRLTDGVEHHAGGYGIEDEGGSGGIFKLEAADSDNVFALGGEAFEHNLLLLGGEGEAGDGGRGVDHLRGDLGEGGGVGGGLWGGRSLREGRSGQGEESAGKQGVAEAGGRADGEEAAAGRGGREKLFAHFGIIALL